MILTETIPASLIFEELDGRPLYYKGYKKVLEKNLSPEEVMGSSFIQALIVTIVASYAKTMLKGRPYWILSNEAGLHISRGNNLNNDIAIFDKASIKNVFSDSYADVAPKVAIEVDTKIESEHFPNLADYIFRKSEKMIEFGTERIFWILTESRKVMMVDSSCKWTVYEWHERLPVLDDFHICLIDLLKEEGVI